MGIPSYFSYIIQNHPEIMLKLKSLNKSFQTHNFYLDSNSIVYDSFYNTEWDDMSNEMFISKLIENVIKQIEIYIQLIHPSDNVFIALDGVAPLAKMDQQRSRRYKSWFQKKISNIIYNKKEPDQTKWSTISITPGTSFMNLLNNKLFDYFNKNKANELNVKHIIVSGSDIVGEGEHKIFEHIRQYPDPNKNNVIYGLDADLIMLSLNHISISPNLFLFRETPNFIKNINNSLDANETYLLNIPYLFKKINIIDSINPSITQRQIVNDYIFLCFFLGNDFLPHFPALNIRTGGINKLLQAYKQTIGGKKTLIDNNNNINWNNVRIVIQNLSENEENFIIDEFKNRNKKEKHNIPNNTPDDKYKQFDMLPTFNRQTELYINPLDQYWKQRYYYTLFNIKNDNDYNNNIKNIVLNYLQGLEWNTKYYTNNCPDWKWSYKYNYPPLLEDIVKYIPIFNTVYFTNSIFNPVTELTQLCYVLPKPALFLLPSNIQNKLTENFSNIYRDDFEFTWAYCKYFWESHVDYPHIDIEQLIEITNNM